jgi:hypothetical protein
MRSGKRSFWQLFAALLSAAHLGALVWSVRDEPPDPIYDGVSLSTHL